jgi:hypothetical protein
MTHVKDLEMDPNMRLLPPELMEMQLSQIELLTYMYPEEGSVIIDPSTKQNLEELKVWSLIPSEESRRRPSLHVTSDLAVVVKRNINAEESIQVHVAYPLYSYSHMASEPPQPSIRLDKPSFMNRKDFESMNASIASSKDQEDEVDVVNTIQMIEEAVAAYMANRQSEVAERGLMLSSDGPFVRAWFYFPSISTRSKRDDLINHAPSYGLTGFLLAGKPGFLCLEGKSSSIDNYMKFIKTESWGDIPAHHKKVSERYRESGKGVNRAFERMKEVTDEVGERRGERANRTDMKALEVWLGERGFGDVMRKLVI